MYVTCIKTSAVIDNWYFFQDTTRVRYSIQRIMPLNYREEGAYLSELLKSDWSK